MTVETTVAEVSETQLPGVGVRHDFVTSAGERIGVITHRTGRKELLVYDRRDPDACRDVVRLDDDDIHTLAELLGGSHVTRELAELQQSVAGLTIDWLPVGADCACLEREIGDFRPTEDGSVSIVAVVRDGRTIPAPPPDFRLREGDTAVAVGTPEGIQEAFKKLERG